ncbi:Na+/H+ antiporter NhaA [Lysinibacter cavernae]|uniref:Na(+)/H(+) antiporter NhaA n=1 Tax=Lysinibacter cavernae TaxID=1640652 RepID=A0A7X5QY96_9MICO|nr:Na+/H+ antiporter NhaA [Lysinibacter cavernae]NIH52136.1 NhaA family Na+:H+ antiporter [Lysinibacter cavernae]NIH55269.1 NhaA family Na+:H+ antiporter [Lysinibacter cavernae]
MSFLRSNRTSAALLLAAAVLGLAIANSPLADAAHSIQQSHIGWPGIGLDLSVGHWISDGILAIFFFIVAIELKHEFTEGDLNSVGKAIRPAIAALGGILVPIAIYLAFTWGSGYEGGWPIPTATDIAFALGVLAVVGRGLPTTVRAFLLALAVLDDLAGILFIAVFFTTGAQIGLILLGALLAVLFGFLSWRYARLRRDAVRPSQTRHRGLEWVLIIGMVAVGLATWYVVYQSGIHATIAGVALGFAMHRKPAHRARYLIEPFSNVIVLPLFAFSAALVTIPSLGETPLEAPFWGIIVALPVGKLIGIVGATLLADRILRSRQAPVLRFGDMIAAGALGGIGFTVSLLMNDLAFADNRAIADQGVLAVIIGSAISIVVSVFVVRLRARHYRALRLSEKDAA